MSWTIADAQRLYGIDAWGAGFFGADDRGRLTVHPTRAEAGVALEPLLARLRRRKVRFPVLLRFPQILKARVEQIFDAFGRAIAEFEYGARYRGVFPIKVNQRSVVIDALVAAGRRHGLGLEAGSKAELTLALAYDLHPEALIICNGYKDEGYVRLALRGRQLGKNVIMIVEKPQEVSLILDVAQAMGVEPVMGVRIRLGARGSGRWERSGGPGAKFGLTTQELVDAVELLADRGALDAFQLLHFHVGSQIPEIKRIKTAVREGARVYAKLHAEGCRLRYLDVGGGLGVDYDGSNTSYEASMNYSVTEYANDVVYMVGEICAAEGVPPPILVSESGRALAAYHAMLVCEVSGQNRSAPADRVELPPDPHESLQELRDIFEEMTRKNHREYLHDAEERREELAGRFELGYLGLRERALAERLMTLIGRKALGFAKGERYVPEEFEHLEKRLITKYIANFSVFQSIPDSWALDQLFPVAPLHRLDERPTVEATLCDVTCDSDGEIDRFVDLHDVRDSLPLHPLRPHEPYYVAILLIGAYQDVLGDYHNLFGRVDEAEVRLLPSGESRVSRVSVGDDARDVLRLFGHDPDAMFDDVRERAAARASKNGLDEATQKAVLDEYREALDDYTYLDFS